VKKLERKFERNNPSLKKLLICALLIVFASSAITTSTAYGREINPAQVPTDNTPATTDENPMLIAPNPQPDNTATILEIAVLVTVITVAAIIVVLRRRTKTSV
jgi:hypothetical protein